IFRIEVPLPEDATHAFEKFAIRVGDFAEASVAVRLLWQGARIRQARVSLGAVSPLPIRADACERRLLELDCQDDALCDQAIRDAAAAVVHGSLPLSKNAHKTHLLVTLAERAIGAA